MDFGFSFSGQFWTSFQQTRTSPRYTELLEKEDLTIEEVLLDADTLTEIRNSN
jgi:hypothetical protein